MFHQFWLKSNYLHISVKKQKKKMKYFDFMCRLIYLVKLSTRNMPTIITQKK